MLFRLLIKDALQKNQLKKSTHHFHDDFYRLSESDGAVNSSHWDILTFHFHHLPQKSCMQGTLKCSLFPFFKNIFYITFHVVDALCSKHMLVALNVLLIVVCHILGPWTLVGTAQCHQSWPCHHHSEISVLPKVGEMNECFSCVLHVFSLVFCADMSLI